MDSLAGFTSANTLATQLITLATGILALSITFVNNILKNKDQIVTWPIKSAWITYLVSVVFGIWTMMAITGSIFDAVSNPEKNSYRPNVGVPALLQIVSFLLATSFLIVYGAKSLRVRPSR